MASRSCRTAEGQAIEIGSGRLIPGFEEQLVGIKEGEERQITVTFPDNYPAENLKGKDATFDITCHAVKVAGESTIDDDFAKELGLESLEQLRGSLRGQLEQENRRPDPHPDEARCSISLPPTMISTFRPRWSTPSSSRSGSSSIDEAGHEEDPEAALKEIEGEKDEYRTIAVRRVRLGLFLLEIGQANGVEVSQQEMQMLIAQAAQQYRPEDRQRFYEYVQSEPLAAAQLRAPLYEDKVVDCSTRPKWSAK